jgi:hypothetical protein
MKRSLIVSLVALGFMVSAQAQNLIRKSAEFRNFDGSETVTGALASAVLPGPGSGGFSIYTKVIAAGIGENILYATISATGDTHDGAATQFSANVDGVACNPGFPGAAPAPAGWITLQKMPASPTAANCFDGGGGGGDCHDNAISYQWCCVLPPASVAVGGPHTVNLRMASSTGAAVFIESAHFYIDATKGGSPTCLAGCRAFTAAGVCIP